MSNTNFKFDRRTPAIYIGNESVKMVWEKGIKTEELAKENAAHIYHLESVVNKVEGTAGEADQRSKDNTQRLDTVQGTANEANERSKNNLTRLDTVQGTALAAKAQAESNTTRLDSVQGTANAAKALAESNQKLLSNVEATANSGKALATECRTLIDGKANIEQVNYANVHLRILGRKLYIVAPTGLLSNDDDTVVFARYVRSSGRYYVAGSTKKIHYRYTGWIRPVYNYPGQGKGLVYPVLMGMKKDIKLSDVQREFFLLSTNAGTFYKARPISSDDIARAFLSCYEYCFNNLNFNFRLFDKKMGVGVYRDGKQITPYLPFTVRFKGVEVTPSEEDPTKQVVDISGATAYLSRWI